MQPTHLTRAEIAHILDLVLSVQADAIAGRLSPTTATRIAARFDATSFHPDFASLFDGLASTPSTDVQIGRAIWHLERLNHRLRYALGEDVDDRLRLSEPMS